MKLVNAIMACGPTGQLGLENDIPWRNSDNPVIQERMKQDQLIFRKVTTDGILLAGPKTHDDLKQRLSVKNLHETNRILFRWTRELDPEECIANIHQYLANRQIWVVGGAYTFECFAPFINGVILTSLFRDYLGHADTYVPKNLWWA